MPINIMIDNDQTTAVSLTICNDKFEDITVDMLADQLLDDLKAHEIRYNRLANVYQMDYGKYAYYKHIANYYKDVSLRGDA